MSSWTHWLAEGANSNQVDRIGVQVDAMHEGKDDHSKKKAGVELKSELDWCNEHSNARGSCVFNDHTPTYQQSHIYPNSLLTPPAGTTGMTTDVFAR